MIPRRILMTADAVGGVWTYCLEMARALLPFDVEVQLAVMGPVLSASQRAEASKIANLSIFKSYYKTDWIDDCERNVRLTGDWLLHLESRLRPDLIHLNGYSHASLRWQRPRLVVAHSCVFSWWESVNGLRPPAEWECYRKSVELALRSVDMVITPTETMLSVLKQYYGPSRDWRVIHNGGDPERFKPATKQNLIFSAGRLWDQAKNIDCLTSISHLLPWAVCIAGNTRLDSQLPQRKSSKNCYYLGQLSRLEMRYWYSAASIYALPARYDPFGYTALEAALSGCALVLGDIESLRETWGDAAVYVDPEDPGALKRAILRLIRDANLREQMATSARTRALNFTNVNMAQSYMQCYLELLPGRSEKEKVSEERSLLRA